MSEHKVVNWKGEEFCWKCRIFALEAENSRLREAAQGLIATADAYENCECDIEYSDVSEAKDSLKAALGEPQ